MKEQFIDEEQYKEHLYRILKKISLNVRRRILINCHSSKEEGSTAHIILNWHMSHLEKSDIDFV